jgi:thiamine biosynthesis lipoprotein
MTIHVEECMGTVFTIDIRDDGDWTAAIAAVVEWLHHVDVVFSTYKADSDISRIRAGELAIGDADPDVGPVVELCAQIEAETGGRFSAYYDGALDPTGLVKGWAIERASAMLRDRGSRYHAINGGGDIQAVGGPWAIGISHPLDPARLVTTVSGHDFAIATSGIAERGAHIVDPRSGARPTELASVTIVGRSLTRVDAYATAAFAMGPSALPWTDAIAGHDALVVTVDGTVAATPGFHRPAGPPPTLPGRRGGIPNEDQGRHPVGDQHEVERRGDQPRPPENGGGADQAGRLRVVPFG